jgi:hypothetical protein
MPKDYPMQAAQLGVARRVGVADGRWRRWSLQIMALLNTQVTDAYF